MREIIPFDKLPLDNGDRIQVVVCAAIRFSDGTIVCSPRHYDQTMAEVIMPLREVGKCLKERCEQGFVDQWGNFLTREEAWIIAKKEGQIIRRVGGDSINGGKLFSENIY